jgi:hypothetical protein
LLFNGTVWQKIDQSNLVTSVAGRTGAVTLANTDISGLGTMSTQNANSVAVTGGTATLTSLTTPTVQATNSGGLSLKNSAGTTQLSMGGGGGDNLSLLVSTNINGTNAQVDISPTGTGHVHIKPTGVNSIEIAPTYVGEIDNMTIGATTASTGAFTTLTASGTTTLSGNQIISVTDNTNAALRITQLGTGNALLVEDTTNPDSTPFVVDAIGNVGIGATSLTTAKLYINNTVTDTANSESGIYSILTANNASGSNIKIGNRSSVTTGASFAGTNLLNAFRGDITYSLSSAYTGSLQGFRTSIANSGSGSVNAIFGFASTPPSNTGGGSITNFYGFSQDDVTTATNVYGYLGSVASGANKFNLYMSGTAANYLAGQLQLGDGTAAAPALSNFGDENTGIFFPAADTIAFSEGGTEVMRITSTGALAFSGASNYGTSGQVLQSNGNAAPTWSTISGSNFASQTANFVLAAPNGSSGSPTFRAIVAADIPTLNQNTTGTASNVTGTVAVANGGTGVTTSTGSGAVVLGTSPTLTTPTINSAQVATVSGTAPLYLCRAWISWTDNNSTTTTRGSGNVTSITRNATSDYTINFTTAMPDVNYSVAGNSGFNSTSMAALVVPINATAPTASAVRVQAVSGDGTLRAVGSNVAFYSVNIFR